MSDKPPTFTFGRAVRRCLLLSIVLLSACQVGPPVQEMSDARMAIAVAKEAGAEQSATEQLRSAEDYLQRAEQELSKKSYAQARRDALHAKKNAMDALSAIEDSQPDQVAPADD